MADYYFPEVNTNGQFTDQSVIADIKAKAKSAVKPELDAVMEEARRLRYAVTRDHTIILDVVGAPNVSVDNDKFTIQIGA